MACSSSYTCYAYYWSTTASSSGFSSTRFGSGAGCTWLEDPFGDPELFELVLNIISAW